MGLQDMSYTRSIAQRLHLRLPQCTCYGTINVPARPSSPLVLVLHHFPPERSCCDASKEIAHGVPPLAGGFVKG